MGYKFSFLSTASLVRRINRNADVLKLDFEKIDRFNEKIKESFSLLKKTKPKLNKLAVQFAELKEAKPVLKDLYEKNEEKVRALEADLAADIKKMLSLISSSAGLMKDVTFDADSAFYKENKKLSRLAKRANAITDEALAEKAVFIIHMLKAEIKSIALKLLEASELEEEDVFVYPKARVRLEPPGIQKYSRGIAELAEETGIKRLGETIRTAEKNLQSLKAIELKIIMLMSYVDRYLDYLKNKVFLFSEDLGKAVGKGVADAAAGYHAVKEDIRQQALRLYNDIKIIE